MFGTILQRNYAKITHYVRYEDIRSHLVSHGIINCSQKEKIEQKAISDRIHSFLSILDQSDLSKTFPLFTNTLEKTGHSHVAKLLKMMM